MHVASLRDDHVGAQRCPLCHAGLATDAAVRTCDACETVAHAECLRDLAGARCPTLGCALSVRVVVAVKPAAWRDWLSWRVAVVVGLVALPVKLLAVNEWRARAAFHELQQDYEGFEPGHDPEDLRALAARLRAAPRGIMVDRSRMEAMADCAEEMATALETALADRARQEGLRLPQVEEHCR